VPNLRPREPVRLSSGAVPPVLSHPANEVGSDQHSGPGLWTRAPAADLGLRGPRLL
jgi:hypothetical protein